MGAINHTSKSETVSLRGLPDEIPEAPWAMTGEEVLEDLSTSREGLTEEEVRRRRKRFGPNRIREIQKRSVWKILWEQIKGLIMLLLVGATIVSLLFGHTVDAIAIAAVIVVNTAIGFITEWRAVRSMEALQKLAKVDTVVRRNDEEQGIPADELVPGDLVMLNTGDVVPADLRLLTVVELELDESALTGESVPVAKQPEQVDREEQVADRTCMTYKGTAVTRGSGLGVVVATGMRTELGDISSMVESAAEEETPLEKKLARLGQRLVWLTLTVAALVATAGILFGRDVYLMVETGIALAVAAIPEGLPIVATVALAHGMSRMLKRNALVRRLSSVETLGATTVICTDKTGTLTENRMTVEGLLLSDGFLSISQSRNGARRDGDETVEEPDSRPRLRRALEIAALCNNADLRVEGDTESSGREGDPMEIALLEAAESAGIDRSRLLEEKPRIGEQTFSRETQMMATYHQSDEGYLVAVKGAPEAVLKACTGELGPAGEREVDEDARQTWQERYEALAEEGLRVLALAKKKVGDQDVAPYEDLCFMGLVGFLDPPREGVRQVIERCQQAGIRVIMVTGDHPVTARKVAHAVGLVRDGEEMKVLHGSDFIDPEKGSTSERSRILAASVFARVTPEQKLDLIDLHRSNGEVVAMTGDGVNDAPALRRADIGVAMGRRGTDVAKETADMVLRDDAFSTIVAAIEQGRIIFSNIRTFVIYLLSGNVGEILAVGAAAVAGLPMPLLPLQILYINLLNDVFPALALGVGDSTRQVMSQPPRNPTEPVITRAGWGAVVGYGLIIAAAVFGVFAYSLYGLELTQTKAVTISFLSLSIARLVHVFNMRQADSGFIKNEITVNPFVWGAIALCVGLLLIAVYVPPLAYLLEIEPPDFHDWLLIIGAGFAPLCAGQIYQFARDRVAS